MVAPTLGISIKSTYKIMGTEFLARAKRLRPFVSRAEPSEVTVLDALTLSEIIVTFSAALTTPYLAYYGYMRRYMRVASRNAESRKQRARVSVIICTLNAKDAIEKKLEEVLHQNYPLELMEVIVVDGGSKDGTIEILQGLRERINSKVRLIVVEDHGFRSKASQINEGIHVASGDYVITTDADCGMRADSIETLVNTLSADQVGAVCSRQVLTNPNESLNTETEVTYRNYYEKIRIAESNLHSTPIYHGGLSAYRKAALSRIDEDVNADDTQLAIAAIRNGYRALYEFESVYYTKAPSSPRQTWSQRVRRGQGLQRVFWRNCRMITAKQFDGFGFPILAAEFYMHIISPLLFMVTAALFAIWVVLLISDLVLFSPLILTLAILMYWKRDWSPVLFLASFVYYQIALFCAMILHLLGHNYSRWSRCG